MVFQKKTEPSIRTKVNNKVGVEKQMNDVKKKFIKSIETLYAEKDAQYPWIIANAYVNKDEYWILTSLLQSMRNLRSCNKGTIKYSFRTR